MGEKTERIKERGERERAKRRRKAQNSEEDWTHYNNLSGKKKRWESRDGGWCSSGGQ